MEKDEHKPNFYKGISDFEGFNATFKFVLSDQVKRKRKHFDDQVYRWLGSCPPEGKFLSNALLQSQRRLIAFCTASLPFQQVSLSLIPALPTLLSPQ